jgi:hypothetical protein
MKKRMFLIILFISIAIFSWPQTPAQPWGQIPNPPVIDITNLIMAIENGMEMYSQLTSMYQIIKTNIEQLNEVRKNFESFDIKQLSIKDPLGSWQKIMTYGSRMITYEQNIAAILNRRDIRIGNSSYSLADLFSGSPVNNVMDIGNNAASYIFIDPFEQRLTPQEKAIFHQKYGMSYGHYLRYYRIGEATSKKAAELTAYNEKLEEELFADREAIQAVLEGQGDGSWVQEQQKINSLLMVKNQNLKTRSAQITDIARMYSGIFSASNEERELNERARQERNVDFGDNYLKMLENLQKRGDYKGHQYPLK